MYKIIHASATTTPKKELCIYPLDIIQFTGYYPAATFHTFHIYKRNIWLPSAAMQLQVLQRMTPKRKVFADEEAARRTIREQKPGNRSASSRLPCCPNIFFLLTIFGNSSLPGSYSWYYFYLDAPITSRDNICVFFVSLLSFDAIFSQFFQFWVISTHSDGGHHCQVEGRADGPQVAPCVYPAVMDCIVMRHYRDYAPLCSGAGCQYFRWCNVKAVTALGQHFWDDIWDTMSAASNGLLYLKVFQPTVLDLAGSARGAEWLLGLRFF